MIKAAHSSESPPDPIWVLIPAYNEEGRIGDVVTHARPYADRVVVVDDSSCDGTSAAAAAAGATVLRHEVNRGKGAALRTGLAYIRQQGGGIIVCLDADGQHDPAEIPKFVAAHRRTGLPVLIGNRMADPTGMPWIRRCTNRFMSALLSREMNQYVPDTQCGYRLFGRDVLPLLDGRDDRFAADSETLLQLAGRGVRIGSVRIHTIYRDELSKIRPVRDALRFFRMWRDWRRGRRG